MISKCSTVLPAIEKLIFMFLSYKLFFIWPCLYCTLSGPPNHTFGFENPARNIKALLRLYNPHMGNWRQNGLSTQDIRTDTWKAHCESGLFCSYVGKGKKATLPLVGVFAEHFWSWNALPPVEPTKTYYSSCKTPLKHHLQHAAFPEYFQLKS